MTSWDERFRHGEYPREPDPSPVLRAYASSFPDGPALDVATGTGRNALCLAGAGFDVEAIDASRAGLEIARENARARGIDDRIEWIQADLETLGFPTDRYAAVAISFYRPLDRLTDLKEALRPGGYLFVEHHLRSTDPTPRGPSGDRYRFGSNELLRACLDLTVLSYDEGTEEGPEGRTSATARILARNTAGPRQSYPERRGL